MSVDPRQFAAYNKSRTHVYIPQRLICLGNPIGFTMVSFSAAGTLPSFMQSGRTELLTLGCVLEYAPKPAQGHRCLVGSSRIENEP
jgi:hypothetical protein